MKNKSKILKELLALTIRLTCIPLFIRNIYAKHKCCIVFYHNPAPEVLDSHLAYLSSCYNIVTLTTLVDTIYSKSWDSMPPNSLVITFDDGHKDNYLLLRVFKKYKIRPTIYLTSSIVGTNRHFWFKVKGVKAGYLKSLTNQSRLDYLKCNFGFTCEKEYPYESRQALDWNEIMEMMEFVDFQAHGMFHPILTTCDEQECRKEIVQCADELIKVLDRPCSHFCYPNGNYTKREVGFVKDAGFKSARTTDIGWNDLSTDPFRLKAIEIPDDASINMLIAKLSGVPGYVCHLKMGSLNGRLKTRIPLSLSDH